MSVLRFMTVVLTLALVAGCVAIPSLTTLTGSGRAVTKTYDFTGFTAVAAGNAFSVEVVQSEAYSVVVSVDDNLVDYLDVTKTGDTLRIYLKPNLSIRNTTLKATVSLPELTGLDASGATRMLVSGFSSEQRLDVQASGASTVKGDIQADAATMDISGASTVDLEGRAAGLRLKVSGASTARLDRFVVGDVDVDASGASHAMVNVSGKLSGEASGASSVRYTGDPTSVQVDTSGASSVGSK